LSRLDLYKLEKRLSDPTNRFYPNIFKIDGETIKITGIVQYYHPTIESHLYLNITPAKLVNNERFADDLAKTIRNVYSTGSKACITVPICPPVKNAEIVYRYVHFLKSNDNKTVLAVVDSELDEI
jgi:hypothetical protein